MQSADLFHPVPVLSPEEHAQAQNAMWLESAERARGFAEANGNEEEVAALDEEIRRLRGEVRGGASPTTEKAVRKPNETRRASKP